VDSLPLLFSSASSLPITPSRKKPTGKAVRGSPQGFGMDHALSIRQAH
jgi:hypothetical protein